MNMKELVRGMIFFLFWGAFHRYSALSTKAAYSYISLLMTNEIWNTRLDDAKQQLSFNQFAFVERYLNNRYYKTLDSIHNSFIGSTW